MWADTGRSWLTGRISGLTTVLVAFIGVLLLGRHLVGQILASGEATTWLAVRGMVLFAGGVGVVIASALARAAKRIPGVRDSPGRRRAA